MNTPLPLFSFSLWMCFAAVAAPRQLNLERIIKEPQEEKVHGDRFGKFAELLEKDRLFRQEQKTGWICLNCGYIYEGEEAPKKCPVCDHDRGYFIRVEQSPFENK